jgi:hypothetical protein
LKSLPKRKVLVIISHSLGELDVVFPLISSLDDRLRSEIEIIVVVRPIYQQLLKNGFYDYCIERLGVSINYCPFPSKFNYQKHWLRSSIFGKALLEIMFRYQTLRASRFLQPRLKVAKVLMYETTNQLSGSKKIRRIIDEWGGERMVYHHGHSLNQKAGITIPSVYGASDALYLLFTKDHKKWGESRGYTNQEVIGFPKLYPQWLETLCSYEKAAHDEALDKFVLIFSRGPSERYMDADKYRTHFIETYQAVREVFDNILIVVKPHPREDSSEVAKIFEEDGLTNIVVSQDHAGVLARSAIVAVSFWTSCIFDSLGQGVPTIEFFKEPRRFREAEPMGSPYQLLGVDAASNKSDLVTFLASVKSKRYYPPSVVDRWRSESLGNQFQELVYHYLGHK